MNTRVIKEFDRRLGIYLYSVWKWALWDDSDLRHYYPNDYGWRYAGLTTPDIDAAKGYAERLSINDKEPPTEVVYEVQP